MTQKIYDLIRGMLEIEPALRSNDKELMFRVWGYEGFAFLNTTTGDMSITLTNFMKATTPETITRARREVQEHHPELQATKVVKEARSNKAKKGHQIVFGQTVTKGFK